MDLQPKVAAIVRELAEAPDPLVWEVLENPAAPSWIVTGDQSRYTGVGATLELHLLPQGLRDRMSAISLERLSNVLAGLGRERALFGHGDALEIRTGVDDAVASRASARGVTAAGITARADHSASVWEELPRDSMGSIIDHGDLTSRFARMLRVGGDVIPRAAPRVGLAIGLGPTQMVTEGEVRDLGRRSSASLGMASHLIRIEARDTVPTNAVASASEEIGRELATRLLLSFRAP